MAVYRTKHRSLSHLRFGAFQMVGPVGTERRQTSRGHTVPSARARFK
jgi:hypothetical protein